MQISFTKTDSYNIKFVLIDSEFCVVVADF